ncbi:hypothetical protein [Spiroplasma endosymbiont of Labia minor]|uniref:hypothetical protein n=1 Tax=Spiroplasma endosymbiont of Labia minor TaxID=3066305 RepID=UPI0030D2CCE3
MKRKHHNEKEIDIEIDEHVLEAQEVFADAVHNDDNEEMKKKSHYHGKHHFDKSGKHDDITLYEFTWKRHFKYSRKSINFRIASTAIILALALAVSVIDSLFEKFSLNISGVVIEMRVLDQIVMMTAIPILSLPFALFVCIVEPWLHVLIDSEHTPIQIAFDSIANGLVVLIFYLIVYMLFKISPYHEDPNKKIKWIKRICPGLLIIPICSLIYTAAWFSALLIVGDINVIDVDKNSPNKVILVLISVTFGLQMIRYLVVYILFVLVDFAVKPINHRLR